MSYKTVEVDLENGQVRPSGSETLPSKARGLLTLLELGPFAVAASCGELADRWAALEKLPSEEAREFADDIEQSRDGLAATRSAWD
jgi:hypothetical protein